MILQYITFNTGRRVPHPHVNDPENARGPSAHLPRRESLMIKAQLGRGRHPLLDGGQSPDHLPEKEQEKGHVLKALHLKGESLVALLGKGLPRPPKRDQGLGHL